ncbi:DsbA family protein [Bosea sp. 685]|uniref:DsbA family protein n=1 Tax=Bosea sp. 685 TaxID=3080057 RepID=UPI002892FE00|nr:DsbA family protein [Bosea sp. 685]WNJ91385.1 DsbA family protein [Bosea sp. 685]
MIVTTRITYLFDPLCGWCYGASAVLEKLVAGPDFAIDLAPTGLFAGTGARPMDDGFAAYAWSNDQRIARLSGQPFSAAYRRDVLGDHTRLFDSGPATLALTAVAVTAPGQEFAALKAIQGARYVEGRDITAVSVLSDVLRALGLQEAAHRLTTPDDGLLAAYRRRIEAAREEIRRFGIDGVPALITGVGESRRLVPGNALFGSLEVLVARLNGVSPDLPGTGTGRG